MRCVNSSLNEGYAMIFIHALAGYMGTKRYYASIYCDCHDATTKIKILISTCHFNI